MQDRARLKTKMTESFMDNESRFMVCIHCMTYNQSAYITDALNGFAMQQTDFPFVALIFDDASTDGEQGVIKKYLEEHFDHSVETEYKEWETEDANYTYARTNRTRTVSSWWLS